MYKITIYRRTRLTINESVEGSTIEQKIERIINNKETITDGAPIIFTERKEGVLPSYNIRTDRWEIAVEGMDKVHRSYQARREEKAKMEVIKNEKTDNNNSETMPTQDTGN